VSWKSLRIYREFSHESAGEKLPKLLSNIKWVPFWGDTVFFLLLHMSLVLSLSVFLRLCTPCTIYIIMINRWLREFRSGIRLLNVQSQLVLDVSPCILNSTFSYSKRNVKVYQSNAVVVKPSRNPYVSPVGLMGRPRCAVAFIHSFIFV